MKKIILFFAITIALSSCKTRNIKPILDLNIDFPDSVSSVAEFSSSKEYDFGDGSLFIDDTVVWRMGMFKDEIGQCYSINTGKQLSVISTIGKASYEFTSPWPGCNFTKDSVQFFTSNNEIKTFLKSDIVENKDMRERAFSISYVKGYPNLGQSIKLSDGSSISTLSSTLSEDVNVKNDYSVVLLSDKRTKTFNTIDYESFDLKWGKSVSSPDQSKNQGLKFSYGNSFIKELDSKHVLFAVMDQFIIYSLNVKTGKIIEKRYTNPICNGFKTTNDRGININAVRTNDEHVVILASGKFDGKTKSRACFIFDKNLNPVRRINIADADLSLVLSTDGKSLYSIETKEGDDFYIKMTKADLSI